MRVVLGVDAAWTATEPSGVAIAEETASGWRLVAVEASYAHFRERAEARAPQDPPRGEPPAVAALLEACRRLAGRPDLVAVDMPLSREPIVGRRASDLAISSAFGARKAATHSPSALRPGALADKLRADFAAEGYRLCAADGVRPPGVMEVYPHAALLELSGDSRRLAYKAGKTTTYWPELGDLGDRRAELRKVWLRIVAMLDQEIAGAAEALPPPEATMKGRALKAYEDKLDAVVCAHVAIAALEGRARAYGDEVSAIWVPLPSVRTPRL